MKKSSIFLPAAVFGILLFGSGGNVMAQYADSSTTQMKNSNVDKKTRSAQQRIAANQIRRNHLFSDLGQSYTDFKNKLNKDYGFDYAVDVSFMPQYGAPNGKKTAFQTIVAPSVTWTTFNNKYGTGVLNMSYNAVQYSGRTAEDIGNRLGVVTDINDYDSQSNSFDSLYYTYQLPGSWNWLTVALGQFPLYNFDGSAYDANQQVNFVNYALSQNASSSYPTASLGGYIQIAPNSDWTFALGAQDATNTAGDGIVFTHLKDKHYTTFASASYTPTIKGLGAGQYSVMVYNMPATFKQPQTTNGWSVNVSQDLNEKFSIFGRVNGVSGNQEEIDQSWVLGMVYNNPLNRNPLDQIGFAGAYNKINEEAVGQKLNHSAEKVLEAYWAWGVSKWMTLTPDIQFYFDPATNPKSDHATVVTLRATLFF